MFTDGPRSYASSPWQKSLRAACAGETACATFTAQQVASQGGARIRPSEIRAHGPAGVTAGLRTVERNGTLRGSLGRPSSCYIGPIFWESWRGRLGPLAFTGVLNARDLNKGRKSRTHGFANGQTAEGDSALCRSPTGPH